MTVSEWPLGSRRRRLLFLSAAVLVAALPAFQAARLATAITLGESADPAVLRHALALDPDDAEIEHRLGMALFYSPSGLWSAERAGGLEHLRRATALNPHEGLYWSDLASACEASHDASCADRAMNRALDVSPMTPRLYWSAANYDLRVGLQAQALARFRRLLDLDPSYAGPVFRVCLQMFGAADKLEQGILAANKNPHVAMAFVTLVSGLGDDDSGYAEWRRIASDAGAAMVSLAEVEPYLDHLIDAGSPGKALTVWNDLKRLGAAPDTGQDGQWPSPAGSARLVFNGGFERNLLNAGFDWRYHPQQFVFVTRCDVAPHGGSHSLRIEFTGDRNQEYEPVFEVVLVVPQHSYALSAFVRSEAITSDTGPRLRVRDLECSASSPCLDVSSPDTLATTPWHAVGMSFTTGAQSRFVRLSVWRPRSRGYPAEISGVFSIDDVSIAEQPLDAALTTRR